VERAPKHEEVLHELRLVCVDCKGPWHEGDALELGAARARGLVEASADALTKRAVRRPLGADDRVQFFGAAAHRELVAHGLEVACVELGGEHSRTQDGLARDLRNDERVAVAIAAHPRAKAQRGRVRWQTPADGAHERVVEVA
jgi:hypothetical protein